MQDNVQVSADGRSSTITYSQIVSPSAELQMKRALTLSNGDLERASGLFAAWIAQDSELRNQIVPELVRYWIAMNLERIRTEGTSA